MFKQPIIPSKMFCPKCVRAVLERSEAQGPLAVIIDEFLQSTVAPKKYDAKAAEERRTQRAAAAAVRNEGERRLSEEQRLQRLEHQRAATEALEKWTEPSIEHWLAVNAWKLADIIDAPGAYRGNSFILMSSGRMMSVGQLLTSLSIRVRLGDPNLRSYQSYNIDESTERFFRFLELKGIPLPNDLAQVREHYRRIGNR